jgi:hypothetical protein
MTFDEWWEKVTRTYDSDSPGFPNYQDCWEAAQKATQSDDMTNSLQTILAYNGSAPDAVQKMKLMASAALERAGKLQ